MLQSMRGQSGIARSKQRCAWYLLYTKPHREDMVSESLRRIDMEVYNPKLLQKKIVKGAYKEKAVPLFPCYVFIRFEEAEYFRLIQYTRGVRRIISAGGRPCEISEDIIEAIKSREKDGVVKVMTAFNEGEPVIIKKGPLKDFIGIFHKELSDRARVIILLNTVTSQRVVIDKDFLQKL